MLMRNSYVYSRSALRMSGFALLVYSTFLWHVLKIVLGRVLSFPSSNHCTNKLGVVKCSLQTRFASSFGNFRLLFIKCKHSIPLNRHGGNV